MIASDYVDVRLKDDPPPTEEALRLASGSLCLAPRHLELGYWHLVTVSGPGETDEDTPMRHLIAACTHLVNLRVAACGTADRILAAYLGASPAAIALQQGRLCELKTQTNRQIASICSFLGLMRVAKQHGEQSHDLAPSPIEREELRQLLGEPVAVAMENFLVQDDPPPLSFISQLLHAQAEAVGPSLDRVVRLVRVLPLEG